MTWVIAEKWLKKSKTTKRSSKCFEWDNETFKLIEETQI